MKKIVADFIKSHGCNSGYSGKRKTLYINGKNHADVELLVLEKFGYGLPFRIA